MKGIKHEINCKNSYWLADHLVQTEPFVEITNEANPYYNCKFETRLEVEEFILKLEQTADKAFGYSRATIDKFESCPKASENGCRCLTCIMSSRFVTIEEKPMDELEHEPVRSFKTQDEWLKSPLFEVESTEEALEKALLEKATLEKVALENALLEKANLEKEPPKRKKIRYIEVAPGKYSKEEYED